VGEILVMGVGNILLGDEGIGIHIIPGRISAWN
jgi:Ni,Fe-hydrogenase maturation factor